MRVTERTLILIKPDGVRRGLSGEILARIERKGLTIAALELKRRTVEAGAVALVSEREADDLVRDARAFRDAVDLALRQVSTSSTRRAQDSA